VLIAAVMLLMCADVLMRNLAGRPIDGVAETVAASIVVIVFLQLPATLRHGRMSRADLFIEPLLERRPAAGRRLRALYSAVGVFACGLIAYASAPPTPSSSASKACSPCRPGRCARSSCSARRSRRCSTCCWPCRIGAMRGRGADRALGRSRAGPRPLGGPADAPVGRGADMSDLAIGFVALGLMLGFVYLGMHIGIALIATSFVGVALVKSPGIGARFAAAAANDAIRDYLFGVVPLFVLMGMLVSVRKVMLFMNAAVLAKPEVFIGVAASKFDAEGRCTDETTRKFVTDRMAAFQRWIPAVGRLRAGT
jgi:hypothetical protein